MNDVLAAVNFAVCVGAVCLHRLDRLVPAASGPSVGVYRRHLAASAGLGHLKLDRPHRDLAPVVLLPRRGIRHDNVRPERRHRYVGLDPTVDLGERALADKKERVAIGEPNRGVVLRVIKG